MKLHYVLLDVFTRERLSGNPLAVVQDADEVSEGQMQAIAREFNLSETVFVRKASSERHSAALRIFTPTTELPFAGHPTVGAAVLLGLQQRLSAIRLELPAGPITAVIERFGRRAGAAHFRLPVLPEPAGEAPPLDAVALALGIAPGAVGAGPYAPALYSAGVPFYLVPVRDTAVLAGLNPDIAAWDRAFSAPGHKVYAFTPVSDERGVDFAARMLAPGREDPATGAAAAALIGLLAHYHAEPDGQPHYTLRQGYEIGRPSRIAIQFQLAAGRLVHAGIGGEAVVVGEGSLDFSD